MKILYLTPQPPDLYSGGGRHCYANLRSLCEYKDAAVDYIGPSFKSVNDFSQYNLSVIASRSYTSMDRLKASIKGVPTSLVQVFSEVRHRVDFRSYDLVFIEFSYVDFIFNYLPQNTPTICCIHNVEADYQGFNRTGFDRLKYILVRKSEQRTIRKASNLLVMHEFDARRLESIYHTKLVNYTIHPVCSFTPLYDTVNMEERENTILFTGSLDSRFNEIGVLEFLNTCWTEIKDCGYSLLVAGKNPSKKLVSALAHYNNTSIIANPPDMELILRKARLIVLPDIYGTGMKLRVAQAMSYGVPVVGTKLGLRGYDDVEKYGFAVGSVSDMKDSVLTLIEDAEILKQLSLGAIEIWKRKYTYEIFRSRIYSILGRL
ncbi:MAG: glycosyltransferase [Alphaproteobacteria bacterium]|nr:MAG: glycosyltransferase [Alphaproteobacteria bacterium]